MSFLLLFVFGITHDNFDVFFLKHFVYFAQPVDKTAANNLENKVSRIIFSLFAIVSSLLLIRMNSMCYSGNRPCFRSTCQSKYVFVLAVEKSIVEETQDSFVVILLKAVFISLCCAYFMFK